jgi:DNA invertase Pin-like site-specific DNA recombinase
MAQMVLPSFPSESTAINDVVSFCKRDGTVYYFHGSMPIFMHQEEDMRSFRMFTSQLVVNGNCSQAEIVRAFGISVISMKRYVKRYRTGGGPSSFFSPPKRRSARVLTPEVMAQAQDLLSAGVERSEVARRLALKPNTLGKALSAGRLSAPEKKARTRS